MVYLEESTSVTLSIRELLSRMVDSIICYGNNWAGAQVSVLTMSGSDNGLEW
jgi:hypothetical protein